MAENDYEGSDRRKYFRVTYPLDDTPKLLIRTHEIKTINVSERGICFLNEENVKFAESLSGKIKFRDGEIFTVEGKVVWKRKDLVGVRLIIPIPYKRIIKEQRYIIVFA